MIPHDSNGKNGKEKATLPCSRKEKRLVPPKRRWWRCGESNPGPMTEPSVFYVRSLLAVRQFCLPPSMPQTADGGHIRRKSPDAALWRGCISKSPKRRSASSRRRGGVNGAAAHWLILARSSGSESELSAVRFSTYSFAGGIHERTRRSRHASLRRTGHRRNRSSPC